MIPNHIQQFLTISINQTFTIPQPLTDSITANAQQKSSQLITHPLKMTNISPHQLIFRFRSNQPKYLTSNISTGRIGPFQSHVYPLKIKYDMMPEQIVVKLQIMWCKIIVSQKGDMEDVGTLMGKVDTQNTGKRIISIKRAHNKNKNTKQQQQKQNLLQSPINSQRSIVSNINIVKTTNNNNKTSINTITKQQQQTKNSKQQLKQQQQQQLQQEDILQSHEEQSLRQQYQSPLKNIITHTIVNKTKNIQNNRIETNDVEQLKKIINKLTIENYQLKQTIKLFQQQQMLNNNKNSHINNQSQSTITTNNNNPNNNNTNQSVIISQLNQLKNKLTLLPQQIVQLFASNNIHQQRNNNNKQMQRRIINITQLIRGLMKPTGIKQLLVKIQQLAKNKSFYFYDKETIGEHNTVTDVPQYVCKLEETFYQFATQLLKKIKQKQITVNNNNNINNSISNSINNNLS